MATVLTLNEALRTHRLNDFIARADADGVAAAARAEFDDPLGRVVKVPQQAGQTSRLPARGSTRGK